MLVHYNKMEYTRDLAFYATHAHHREARAYKAVANGRLCLVDECRLTNAGDQNEILLSMIEDLNKVNKSLRRRLVKAERSNDQLHVLNAELKFQNDLLQSQHTAMRNAFQRVKEVNKDFQVVAASSFASKLAPLIE